MFFLIVSVCLSFVTLSNTNSVPASSITGNIIITQVNIFDEVSSRYTYLTDDDGYKYGATYYVKNNSNKKLRVFYGLSGSENVFVSYNGGYADLYPGQEEWAATVTAADPTKAWSGGTLTYEWKEIE